MAYTLKLDATSDDISRLDELLAIHLGPLAARIRDEIAPYVGGPPGGEVTVKLALSDDEQDIVTALAEGQLPALASEIRVYGGCGG